MEDVTVNSCLVSIHTSATLLGFLASTTRHPARPGAPMPGALRSGQQRGSVASAFGWRAVCARLTSPHGRSKRAHTSTQLRREKTALSPFTRSNPRHTFSSLIFKARGMTLKYALQLLPGRKDQVRYCVGCGQAKSGSPLQGLCLQWAALWRRRCRRAIPLRASVAPRRLLALTRPHLERPRQEARRPKGALRGQRHAQLILQHLRHRRQRQRLGECQQRVEGQQGGRRRPRGRLGRPKTAAHGAATQHARARAPLSAPSSAP